MPGCPWTKAHGRRHGGEDHGAGSLCISPLICPPSTSLDSPACLRTSSCRFNPSSFLSGNLIPLAVVLFMQVVNLKNGSVMKYLDPTTKQITGMVYCPQERAVLTASSNGQVGAHSVVAVGCLCAICCRFLVLLLLPIAGSGKGMGDQTWEWEIRLCDEQSTFVLVAPTAAASV